MSPELEQLSRFRATDAAPDPDARAAARAALLERIAASADAPSARPRRARAGRASRRHGRAPSAGVLAALGTLAAVAAVAIALAVGGDATEEARPQPATGPEAPTAPPLAPDAAAAPFQPGEYWYQRIATVDRHGARNVREDWHSVDGGWRMVQRGDNPAEYRDPPRRRAVASYTFFPHDVEYAGARRFPTDPERVLVRFRQAALVWARQGDTAPIEHEMFTMVGDWLRASPALPAPVRRAVFGAGERIPGVERLGLVRDARGRVGVGIAERAVGQRRELVFDRAAGALLQERTSKRGATTWRTTYLAAGRVSSTEERP